MPKVLILPPDSAVAVPEITDSGIYVRFGAPRRIAQTLIRREWPFLAVDIDRFGRAIGIEAIPRPIGSVRRLAAKAGVLLT